MSVPQAITSEIQKLQPSAIVELFEIDATSIGGEVLRFHAGTNGLRQSVVWQGNTYMPFPMQATGFDFTGNGQLPRPKLVMSNVSGAMTLLVLSYDDLLGAKVTRRRTLAKYLDAVNFPARRNLIAPSVPNNTNWTVHSGFPGVPNYGIAPDGTQTTYRTSQALPAVYSGAVITPGQTYTYSVFVKTSPTSSILIYADGNFGPSGAFAYAWGSAPNVFGSFTLDGLASAASATDAGGGWYRLTLTFTPLGGTYGAVFIFPATSDPQEWWGAQLELGSSATDYQPVGTTWSQNPTADPAAEFPVDVFFIDRKASETRDVVEFELASSFDVAGVQLPRRQIIQNVCPWRYRGTECGYSGTNYFDANDAAVGTLAQDVCGKRLSSCKARFGTNNPLPFGSFPAAGLTR